MKERIETKKRAAPRKASTIAARAPAGPRPTRAGREAERDRLMAVLRQGHFVTAAQLADLHNAEHPDAWLLGSDVEMHLRVLLGRGAVVKAESDVKVRWAVAPLESVDDGVRVEVRTYVAEPNPPASPHAGWRVLRRDPGQGSKIVVCPSVDQDEAHTCARALNEMIQARLAREAESTVARGFLSDGDEVVHGARLVNVALIALADRGVRWVADLMREPYLDRTYAYLGPPGFWRLVTEAQMRQLGEATLGRGTTPPEVIVADWLAGGEAGTEISHSTALGLGLELGPGVGLERADGAA